MDGFARMFEEKHGGEYQMLLNKHCKDTNLPEDFSAEFSTCLALT